MPSPWAYGAKAEAEAQGCYDDWGEPTVRELPLDHPYLCIEKPVVVKLHNGLWSVRWRTFDTIKQDIDCATEEEANAEAERVRAKQHIVYFWGEAEEFGEADAFWRSM